MLGLRREQWRTVVGGSREYVRLLLEQSRVTVRLGNGVAAISRSEQGSSFALFDGTKVTADGVVLATSAPTALALLESPTPRSSASCSHRST